MERFRLWISFKQEAQWGPLWCNCLKRPCTIYKEHAHMKNTFSPPWVVAALLGCLLGMCLPLCGDRALGKWTNTSALLRKCLKKEPPGGLGCCFVWTLFGWSECPVFPRLAFSSVVHRLKNNKIKTAALLSIYLSVSGWNYVDEMSSSSLLYEVSSLCGVSVSVSGEEGSSNILTVTHSQTIKQEVIRFRWQWWSETAAQWQTVWLKPALCI